MCTDASLSQVNGLTARAARARVVAEMTTNWERHYVHFVDVDVRDVYLAQMSEHGTYGDHCTLVAFASAFNVRIRVWGADDTHDTVVPSVFGFVYIQITKSYESLQSEHSLEYMPKT